MLAGCAGDSCSCDCGVVVGAVATSAVAVVVVVVPPLFGPVAKNLMLQVMFSLLLNVSVAALAAVDLLPFAIGVRIISTGDNNGFSASMMVLISVVSDTIAASSSQRLP